MWYHYFLDAREARPDAWGGVGVFATEKIPKGELVESGVVQRLCHGKVNERHRRVPHFSTKPHQTGVIKWDPFWGNETIQIYGNLRDFPYTYNNEFFGLVI